MSAPVEPLTIIAHANMINLGPTVYRTIVRDQNNDVWWCLVNTASDHVMSWRKGDPR